MDYWTIFSNAGLPVFCLVLLLMATPLFWAVPSFGALRLRIPTVISIGFVQLALMIGWLGAHWNLGYADAMAATSHAALLTRNVGYGVIESLHPLSAGSLVAAWIAIGSAMARALSAAIGVGGKRRMTPFSATAAIPMILVACGCAYAGTWMGASICLLAAVSIALVSAWASTSGTDNERLAAARASVGICGVFAIVLVLLADLTASSAGAIQGSGEIAGAFQLHTRHLALLTAAGMGSISTIVATGPLCTHLRTLPSALSGFAVLMALGPNALFAAGYAWRIHGLGRIVDAPERVLAQLEANGISPAHVTFTPGTRVNERQLLTFGEEVTFDGKPVDPDTFQPGGPPQPEGYEVPEYVVVQAPGDMELGRILPFTAKLSRYRVVWHVNSDEGLLGLVVTPRTQAAPLKSTSGIPTRFLGTDPEILLAEKHGPRWRLAREIEGELRVADSNDMRGTLLELHDIDELHVQFRATDTVQDLMNLVSIAHDPSMQPRNRMGPSQIELVWRIDEQLVR